MSAARRAEAMLRAVEDPRFLERFMAGIIESGGCWEWSRYRSPRGYGITSYGKDTLSVHRIAYTIFVGKIAPELEIDHLCRNHACARPEHLEAVPHQVNVRRGDLWKINGLKTHCRNGHPFDERNTARSAEGHRACVTCRRRSGRESERRRRAGIPQQREAAA